VTTTTRTRSPSLTLTRATAAGVTVAVALAGHAGALAPAHADPAAGVDSYIFRPAMDNKGVFSLDGADTMEKHDLAARFFFGYGQSPLSVAVPGIGDGTGEDVVLKFAVGLDIAIALALSKKLTVSFDAGLYRTDTDNGYGVRGRYNDDNSEPSTGLIALRPLSNIDPSGGFVDEGVAGPLDVRLGAKYKLTSGPKLSTALVLVATLPFGEEEMFLGDGSFVFEPKLAIDYKFGDALSASKFVVNAGARIRERTVLESYDKNNETPDMATAVLDIGSEALVGAGVVLEAMPRVILGAEAMAFIPLPSGLSYGDCTLFDGKRCSTLDDADYFEGGGAGDLAAYAMAGATFRATADVGVALIGGAGLIGARGDAFRITAGITWTPSPAGAATIGRGDKDADNIPDISDVCSDEPEDRDNYQDEDGCPDLDNDGDGIIDASDACIDDPEDKDDHEDEDGCPERDNDGDGVPDVTDRCPMQKEDVDGFEDGDGCSDEDNDGDGIADGDDKCPNEAEVVNGFEDADGCPDARTTTGPEEGVDRINLRGNKIEFAGDKLTNSSKTVLEQVADLIKDKGLAIRIEVHVPLGTGSKVAKVITKQKQKDKDTSARRAQVILDFLVSKGVKVQQLGAVGLGSDRPLGNNPPTDPLNARVDLIKTRQ
jgi:outer membrane protein OmpA-like peptidoglycan-associated protein